MPGFKKAFVVILEVITYLHSKRVCMCTSCMRLKTDNSIKIKDKSLSHRPREAQPPLAPAYILILSRVRHRSKRKKVEACSYG